MTFIYILFDVLQDIATTRLYCQTKFVFYILVNISILSDIIKTLIHILIKNSHNRGLQKVV